MYGVEVWIIFQEHRGNRYYYKGTENRGRRVWTSNQNKAYIFSERNEAIAFWNKELQRIGGITGKYI